MAKELSTQKKWRPWKGFILYLIAFAWLIVSSFVQMSLGTTGLLISQLGFLAIAIIACLVNKTPLKEVFPIRKLTVRDFFGTVMMWVGGLMIGLTSIYAVSYFLPDISGQVIGSLNEMALGGGLMILSFITMVICPPICEEAIMRGAILSNFRGIKKDWVIVLIIGIMFGVLHTDPIRFINTTILGATLAYLMVKRNNFILPMLAHFLNNFTTIGISIISGAFAGNGGASAADALPQTAEAAKSFYLTETGCLLMIFFIAPVLIAIGSHLIKRQKEISEGLEPSGMKLGFKVLISAVLSVAMLVSGIVVLNKTDYFSQVSQQTANIQVQTAD